MEMQHQNSETYYQKANKKVKKIKAFYTTLVVYILVNSGLAAINFIKTPHHIWFIWPLFGWGIGLLMQGLSAFDLLFCKEWEERKTREIAAKMQGYKKVHIKKD